MKSILVLIGIVALVGCGTPGTERPVVSAEARLDTDGVQRIDVDMHSYYFEPNRIVVKAGTPVVIDLHNKAHIVPHNFSIEHPDLKVSGDDEVRFTPTKPGEYRIFCHKGDHEKKGMTGTLVVVP